MTCVKANGKTDMLLVDSDIIIDSARGDAQAKEFLRNSAASMFWQSRQLHDWNFLRVAVMRANGR